MPKKYIKKPKKTPALTRTLRMRDVTYLKPKGYEEYLTLTELSREIQRDESWIRRLERAGRLPKPRRFPAGEIMFRLYSPMQVDEIRSIMHSLKRGRPKKS
jgi:hypothetical protein